jgi:hypothetical protein
VPLRVITGASRRAGRPSTASRLLVYGIEDERFDAGNELSPPVVAAVEQVRLELLERLGPTSLSG